MQEEFKLQKELIVALQRTIKLQKRMLFITEESLAMTEEKLAKQMRLHNKKIRELKDYNSELLDTVQTLCNRLDKKQKSVLPSLN